MRLEKINLVVVVDLNNPTTNFATNFNNQFNQAPNNNYHGKSYNRGVHRNLNRPTCQLCGRQGHVIAFPCYHRFGISFLGP